MWKITPYYHQLIVGGGGGGRVKGLLSRGRGGGGINSLLSQPSSYLNPSPLSRPPSLPSPTMNLSVLFFPATISKEESIWNERQLQCCVLFPFLTPDFKFEWLSRTNKCLLTRFISSGSDADVSHLLYRMKMSDPKRSLFTLRKKFFTCKWQGYQMKNYPTSMGWFYVWMLSHWLDKFLL